MGFTTVIQKAQRSCGVRIYIVTSKFNLKQGPYWIKTCCLQNLVTWTKERD